MLVTGLVVCGGDEQTVPSSVYRRCHLSWQTTRMDGATFERTRPEGYLTRLAASDLGQSYKSLALSELGIAPGHTVLDLGCGPAVSADRANRRRNPEPGRAMCVRGPGTAALVGHVH